MARSGYQPVDRDAEAQGIIARGGIARARLTPSAARVVGTKAAYLVPSRSIPNLHYLVPSRSIPNLHYYYAHPRVGCECDDWRFNHPTGGCAHMRAAAVQEQQRAAR